MNCSPINYLLTESIGANLVNSSGCNKNVLGKYNRERHLTVKIHTLETNPAYRRHTDIATDRVNRHRGLLSENYTCHANHWHMVSKYLPHSHFSVVFHLASNHQVVNK